MVGYKYFFETEAIAARQTTSDYITLIIQSTNRTIFITDPG